MSGNSSVQPTCDIFVSAFSQSVTLGVSALISSGVPAYEGISADAVATLPIGLSVLRRIFVYSGNVAGHGGAPCAPTFSGEILASASELTPYLLGNLRAACAGAGANYAYLNPSYAVLPSTHAPVSLPVYVNGVLSAGTTGVSSVNNMGVNAANVPKGAQMVAYPSGATVEPARMVVKFDFLRYLSGSLFNTPYGLSLFTNQPQVFDNLDAVCLADVQGVDALLSVAAGAPGWTRDSLGNPYCKDPATNVCCSVMQSMYAQYPTRFDLHNAVPTSAPAAAGYYYVPFAPGDTLRHILEVAPNPLQTQVVANVSPNMHLQSIPSRKYEIAWVVVDDVTPQTPALAVQYGVMAPGYVNAVIPY